MIIEDRQLEQIRLRHLGVKRGPAATCVVWWYGAILRNFRNRTLPLVVVWFRELLPNGSLGPGIRHDVGITDLALLQLGTIWNEGASRSQILLEEREVTVDFSPQAWRFENQARVNKRHGVNLIPPDVYPLSIGSRDRSEVLVFDLPDGRELLVPSLEFFSRCYGRSAEVNRVLSTYPWTEAEQRLHLPHTQAVPSTHWSVKLPANIYNDDALFVAHVKYDIRARIAAKSIYSSLETQFDKSGGLAFPQIGPWFVGPAKLIVQGIPLDRDRFLALRIVAISEPSGPCIWSFRENPGEADEPAPGDAPQSRWNGGRDRAQGDIRHQVNITPNDPAGHDGDTVEVRNPGLRIVGERRDVSPQILPKAKTRPAPPVSTEKSDEHSPGERQGSGRATGTASIHTESQLESRGAARDVWDALLHLHDKFPHLIDGIGWYSPQADAINFTNREPCMVGLLPSNEEEQRALPASERDWIYVDKVKLRTRGVLIAFVKTRSRSAYLFEIERRSGPRKAGDGSTSYKEQSFCGLIVSPPADLNFSDWIPKVLEGIRREHGVMARVAQYCPSHLVDHYRRSSSMADEIVGHSTVVAALRKIGIEIPPPGHRSSLVNHKAMRSV